VLALYSRTIESVQDLLRSLMASEPPPADCTCRTSLKDAVITPDGQVPASLQDMLAILRT